jgi:uncharacterized protein with HEPN domain
VKRTEEEWLLDALGHIDTLKRYVAGDNAAALRLSAAIDSVARIPEEHRQRVMSDQLWREIKGVRNHIAHGYGFADRVELYNVVIDDVADFEMCIRAMLEQAPE